MNSFLERRGIGSVKATQLKAIAELSSALPEPDADIIYP